MLSPDAIVRHTLPNLRVASPFLWAGFAALHKVHRFWRMHRKAKLYSNPDNFAKLLAGHATNHLVGDKRIVRAAALCALIATRILECVEQQRKLQRSWEQLVASVRGIYVQPVSVSICSSRKSSLLSPSFAVTRRIQMKRMLLRVQRVAIGILHVASQAFQLSMKIMDAVELFSFSPDSQNEAMDELFVNGAYWWRQMEENREYLAESLDENRTVVTRILEGSGSRITVDQLIQKVAPKKGKEKEGPLDDAGEFAKAFGKKILFDVAKGIGLEKLLSQVMEPPVYPFQEIPALEDGGRFPPKAQITLKTEACWVTHY